jgi:hypothetical protein
MSSHWTLEVREELVIDDRGLDVLDMPSVFTTSR